jgi:hypothetical protein
MYYSKGLYSVRQVPQLSNVFGVRHLYHDLSGVLAGSAPLHTIHAPSIAILLGAQRFRSARR